MELACLHRHKTQGRYFKVREKVPLPFCSLFFLYRHEWKGTSETSASVAGRIMNERSSRKDQLHHPLALL